VNKLISSMSWLTILVTRDVHHGVYVSYKATVGTQHESQEMAHKEPSMMTLQCYTYPSIDMRADGFIRADHLAV
jgi:hypothetical protein